MDSVLINSLIAGLAVSSLSLVGAIGLTMGDKLLKKISIFFVAFSTGALLGGAFFHLLPEATEGANDINVYVYLIIGIAVFYFLERILKWHHCHSGEKKCTDVHTFTYMSLIGDSIHNFIDGLVIVSAFSVSFEVGFATTIAVISHEIPQELSDFSILIHGGFSKTKALLWNFTSAIIAIFGVFVGYLLVNNVKDISLFLLPFAAGGFIYVSMSDLIPELHKEENLKKSIIYFLVFMVGLAFMYFTKMLFE
jgi:zinc and cadmium transporter